MQTFKITSKYSLLLGLITLIGTALSSGIYYLTKPKIEAAMIKQQRELMLQVVPQQYFDNDLIATCHAPEQGTLQQAQITKVCEAKKSEKTTALIFQGVAHDGYSGDIWVLVGMTPSGEILGVRVTEHHETPGLGDKIETRISDWILSFNHQIISHDNQQDWAVKKDGGKFDQFSGATITPRAVVNQVKRSALAMLEEQKN